MCARETVFLDCAWICTCDQSEYDLCLCVFARPFAWCTVLVAGERGAEDVAAPACEQTFQQEQLHSVGIQEILNVMHKYTHESAKSSSRLLLLEAVGTFTFMMDDVNR